MPLVVSTLASDLEAVFASQPLDAATSAKKMAMAYDSYCKAGMAGIACPVFTGSEAPALESVLLGAISSPAAGGPPVIAAAWAAGIQAYWLSPPVVFTAPPILGTATAMLGAATVIPGLTAVFLNIANTSSTCAQTMAAVLDAATKTVLVTFTTPPPPAGPPPPAPVV